MKARKLWFVLLVALAAAPGVAHSQAPAPLETVTVRPDPSYQGREFQGWGTSLVWFAHATGDYPPAIRERLAQLVFGEDGLNLNLARYNIGGGNAPEIANYMRPGTDVQGWWKAPAGITRADKDWWDPENPDHWNWNADRTQRWWIDRIKSRITRWEAFSNSPPWFQTVSGWASGGTDPNAEQLRADSVDEFATYLARVVERVEREHGIAFDTVDPFNEPNTNYWSTTFDNGAPKAKQEGAHIGPQMQQQVIRALARELGEVDTDAVIAAMDETNPGLFATNWNTYPEDVRALVGQLNVHTYGTAQRTTVRDIAKGEDKPLWMSEVEGTWGTGQDFTSMLPGLGIADRMADDLRELEPDAWLFWQPVEDENYQKPHAAGGVGGSATGGNWGSIQIPFGCTAQATLETCPIKTNTKFHTIRNFTHYIRPGDRFVKVDEGSSVAAISGGGRATVVHINESTAARVVNVDLSQFGTIAPGATVTPVITSASGALVRGAAVSVRDGSARIEVPAQSVTTLLVEGVSGVAAAAPLAQDGHRYRLVGVQSARSLAPAATGAGAVIRTTNAASAEQLWTLTRLGAGHGNRTRYELANGTRRLAVVNNAVALQPDDAEPPAAAQWIMSTTGDGTYTLVNVASKRALEVGAQATADNSAVTTFTANSGNNQRWRVTDETLQSFAPIEVFTTPGTVPAMPATAVPVYRDGPRAALSVTWQLPPASAFADRGPVPVTGTATDALGAQHTVRATVEVDTLVSTRPARTKVAAGGEPTLPATVTAVGTRGITTERPVTWDAPAPGAFAQPGVVTVQGAADAGDGRKLPAAVRVQVTEPVHENAALAPGATVAATFTEPGYSAAALRNGNLTDKAWSNWRSGTKNASDTLTVTLPARRTLARVVTHFYRDGTTDSYAQQLRIQTRTAAGTWVDASGDVPVPAGAPAPAVAVPLATPVTTDAVRVVLTARPNLYITASEVEVFALAPGRSSDARAATIAVGGTPIAGFDPATLTYRVPAGPGAPPAVTADPADPYADVQVTTSGRTATVKVTSEDGSQTRTYTVDLPAETSAGGGVGGTVPATLSLSVGAAPGLGSFTPGVAREYEAALAATVTSTAGDAALTVSDPSPTTPGRLVNGAFSLARPLELRAGAGAFAALGTTPLRLLDYDGPVSNDAVTIGVRQAIGATEPLRTGSYAKTLAFTLSTTAP